MTILPGQRVQLDGEWRTEGDTVEVDDYTAQVLVHSDVAEPADADDKPQRKRRSTAKK